MRNKILPVNPRANAGPFDFLIVGSGPAGLACALELSSIEAHTVVIEKGCIADSVYRFPDGMRFFSDCSSLEFAGFPMMSRERRPTKVEAIHYYRDIVHRARIHLRQRETVLSIAGQKGDFLVRTTRATHRTRYIIVATGFYGEPNPLCIPGESLHKVAHYYRDAHPYFGHDVAVIGGRNSAGIVATELADAGARVTLIHHRDRFGMKPWIASDLQTRIEQGTVRALMSTRALAIDDASVLVRDPHGEERIENDFVFAMTGYRPDFEFLRCNGLPIALCGTRPVCNPETLESGRPGVYYAGTVMAGLHTHEIAIEAARHHGSKIVAAILAEKPDSATCRGHSQVSEMRDYTRPDP